MSKKFLAHLNGDNHGNFSRWLNNFKGEPRIAWYPSAGEDFRDLMYLHPKFSTSNPGTKPDPQPPDIFLHTDYFPWSESTFLDNRTLHIDGHTVVSVKSIEELPRCDLPLDDRIVSFPQGSDATGRVLFLEVAIASDQLGEFSLPVIYAFVENSVFCAEYMLGNNAQVSHIVHIRYGGGLGGGGKSTGEWLLNTLRPLHCECFITDGRHNRQSGDERIYSLYPALAGAADHPGLEPIRVIPGVQWSDHGDVSWNIVKPV